MSLWPKMYLGIASNGHLIANWPGAGRRFIAVHYTWLRLKHGLRRAGRAAGSRVDVILPDLVGPGIRLKSGWDRRGGFYLLSESHLGDDFLKRILARVG